MEGKMKKTFLILLILLFTFSFCLYAQELNLTGTWKLDSEKSEFPDFGGMGGRAPQTRETTLIIGQEDNVIKIETVTITQRGERKSTITLVIGGGETQVESTMGRRRPTQEGVPAGPAPVTLAKAELSEDGNSLIITTTTQRGEFSSITTSTYSLSEDGKILTEKQTRTFGDRESESVLVYNKV